MTRPFLDTSVLLGGLIDLGPTVRPAQDVMAAVAEGRLRHPMTSWHCCLEFYAVATRLPEEFRLAPADAVRLLDAEILGRFEVGQLSKDRRLGLLRDAVEDRVAGGRIYDAHIAEIARECGAKVVITDNVRHFSGLVRHGVRVATSSAFAAELRSKSAGNRRL
ncbi:MAG: PIN domain-containing protein [Vicinamibacteria bacterium]